METRILIVDDDPFICRQLEELYTSQQYAVSSAPNAPEALRLLQEHEFSLANMVSRNRVMHEIFETIGVLAQNDATVLIYGESGTGKELAARAIHFQGKRKGGRFVAINCAAFPDTLLESELFGYERGAF